MTKSESATWVPLEPFSLSVVIGLVGALAVMDAQPAHALVWPNAAFLGFIAALGGRPWTASNPVRGSMSLGLTLVATALSFFGRSGAQLPQAAAGTLLFAALLVHPRGRDRPRKLAVLRVLRVLVGGLVVACWWSVWRFAPGR